ncbi:MAG: hypothetical protein QME41_08820 [Actinomycetota bacterium]|nr:hypothetical protein [Actinomycetota bacterium]
MKKTLVVVLLVGILVLSMAGIAFANPITQIGLINTAIKTQLAGQVATVDNNAVALSGPAVGVGAGLGLGVAASPATATNFAGNSVIQAVIQ